MLRKLVRKALTKPIWYYQRNRPYFIISKFLRLDPIVLNPSIDGCHVYVLCTTSTLYDGAFSAWSWARNSAIAHKISIVVDGGVDRSSISIIKSILPFVEIKLIEDLIDPILRKSIGLKQLYDFHPLGKKLLMILSLQVSEPIIYSDCDVLVFGKTEEIFEHLERHTPAFNQEEIGYSCYDDDIINYSLHLGVKPCMNFNSGLLLCAKNILDLDLAECLARFKSVDSYNWFVEQTILAVVMGKADAVGLPRQRYVVNTKGQFAFDSDIDYQEAVARHYTGPVRHLMYTRGYSLLLNSRLT